MKKLAAIVGGAQGIGRAIAERLGREGFALALCDISEKHLDLTSKEMAAAGFEVKPILTDVADEMSVSNMVRVIDEKFGRLDVLVNSAGILGLVDNKAPKVEETPLALWDRVLQVNLTGPFLVCRTAIPLMRRNGWGRIVNIASRAARTRSGDPAYSASNAGLVGFSRFLAGDVAQYGITVNCIAPSFIPTGLVASMDLQSVTASSVDNTPLGRLGTPKDIAGTTAFLVSDDASFITGSVIDVNGGSYMQ